MKKICCVMLFLFPVFMLSGCAGWDRTVKDFDSDINGGLNRIVTVYDNTGNQIAVYEGKIDIEDSEYGNKVKFDLEGKRIVLYNCSVIVEEK